MAALSLSPRGTHVAIWENSLEVRLLLKTAFNLVMKKCSINYIFCRWVVEWSRRFLQVQIQVLASATRHGTPAELFLQSVVGIVEQVITCSSIAEILNRRIKVHILDNTSWTAVCTLDLSSRISRDVVSTSISTNANTPHVSTGHRKCGMNRRIGWKIVRASGFLLVSSLAHLDFSDRSPRWIHLSFHFTRWVAKDCKKWDNNFGMESRRKFTLSEAWLVLILIVIKFSADPTHR